MEEIQLFENLTTNIENTDLQTLEQQIKNLNPCIMEYLTEIVLEGTNQYEWKTKIAYLQFFRLLLQEYPDM